ncbi:transposase [Roseomonas eburnea]|uniref:Transposase n=1 Tax=Neoroseomonas eburnea TaxID=1346889 RepID=A0A9X9XKN6_9PROT|nr:transposase [Neoroseomonas eburnea]MBR0684272.1 transposase [Neoroseomonas eburnea]
MTRRHLCDARWSSLLRHVSGLVDLDGTARRFGAVQRVRRLGRAEDLLRLALLYGPGGLSLRGSAEAACALGMAETLSGKAVLGRLRRMGDWLDHILRALLDDIGVALGGELALVDGTLVYSCGPGRPGFRVHALYEPALGRFTDFRVTTDRVREAATNTRLAPARTMLFDRGFARVRDIAAVLGAGSDMVTRIGWRSMKLFDQAAQRLDVMALLPSGDAPCERQVHIAGVAAPLRLVVQRLPPAQAASQARRTRRRASKNCQRPDARTERAAGYLMLLTSLPAERADAAQVVDLYRARWQVELGFKRLKSLGALDSLRAANPALARTWLLAHSIAAVLTEELASRLAGFSPQRRSIEQAPAQLISA